MLNRNLISLDGLTRNVWVIGIVVGLAAIAGVATSIAGILVLPLTIGLFVPLMIFYKGHRVFLWYLIGLLIGYQFAGKGFAYAGLYPAYVGELGIALGILVMAILIGLRSGELDFGIPSVVIIGTLFVFLGWQVLNTLPYIPRYGLDTVRDGMVYGYSIYAFLILLLVPQGSIKRFIQLYGKLIPPFLLSAPIIYVIGIREILPAFPGAPVPMLFVKAGDVGVHMSGAAAFLLLRLDRYGDKPYSRPMIWLLWGVWLIVFAFFSSLNRSGMVSVVGVVSLVFLLRPRSAWYRPLVIVIIVLWMLLVTNLYSSMEFKLGFSSGRSVSIEQIVNNALSVVGLGDEDYANLSDTKEWRFEWWGTIIDYTFDGPYFMMGKGYGVNLALDDGAYSEKLALEKGTRSPHNVSMTFLARSGVPGLILWLLFLAVFIGAMIRYVVRAFARQNQINADHLIWILAYFIGHLINAHFDVFLEGPMGGIWFWSLFGMGLVYLRAIEGERAADLHEKSARQVAIPT